MATELGKAYVQIMPSAKGISGNIQKTLNPEATEAGKSAGKRMATAISNSLSSAGSTLTKAITVPALGAATAIGGIVSALGWGRLTGLDAARAKLQGLGYDAKAVERISGQVREAIQGTVTTMAEGTSVAAGALAAGVKEGEELQRYIKLVGDAAVGANRPVADMAMIFNRVQGAGKMMTQELNMIEDGMPGFAMAMAKSLGVTQEEFRKMVTDGKVSSNQFLDVMEEFAGSMSDAYANSWAGMVANTKSNIGIIGETILSGVFEQSKETIADFLAFLRSDDLRSWAAETGKVVGQVFENILTTIREAISWWINLDGSTKRTILTIAGIAVAAGPVLLILSKLVTVLTTLSSGFGLVKAAAGIVGGVIGAISAPVLLTIGALAGLVAVIVSLYNHNEAFRELVHNVWENIKELIMIAVQTISDFLMETIGSLVEWWNEHGEMIRQAAENVWNFINNLVATVMDAIWNIMQKLWPVIEAIIVSTWEAIKGAIQGAINVITGIIQFFAALFTGNWSELWESVKQIVSGAVQLIWNVLQLWFVGRIVKLGKTFFSMFRGIFSSGFNFIRNLVSNSLSAIRNTFSNIFNGLRSIVSGAFNRVRSAVTTGMRNAFNAVKNFFGRFKDAGRRIITSIADGIKGAISSVTDAISGVVGKIRDFLPFSPAKVGPLKDLDKLNFGGTISMGIENGTSEVQKAMDSMLSIKTTRPASGSLSSEDREMLNILKDIAEGVRENKDFIIDGKTFATATADYYSAEGGNRIRRVERGLAT